MTQELNKTQFLEKVFNFEEIKTWDFNKELPVIIDFYADWCAPCRSLSPILEQVSEVYKGKINVYKVNTEKEPELASAFGVRSLPSLLFCPIGEQPQMATGVLSKQEFDRIIGNVFNINR